MCRASLQWWFVLACALAPGCAVDEVAVEDGALAADGAADGALPDGDRAAPDAQPQADLSPAQDAAAPAPDGAAPDGAPPPADAGPAPVVTCVFPAGEGEQEVNTWMGQADRAVFTVALPALDGLQQASLRFEGWDLDNVGEEGWIRLNRAERFALPSDAGWTNTWQALSVDVTAQVVAGENQVRFLAYDRPEGSFFRIRDVRLEVTGQVTCPEPVDPVDPVDPPDLGRVANLSPLGISAFAALAPDFPRAETLGILGAFERPFTTVLLDFAPVYARHGLQMFAPGAVGQRAANPAHLAALEGFIQAYIDASPDAAGRHLQIYLFNGPGVRRPGYARAFVDLDPSGFDRAVRQDDGVRADIVRFGQALVAALAPYRDRVDIRLVGALEDDLSREGAQALNRLLRDAGWDGDLGRNPCGCAGPADTSRVGQFHELHPHSVAATRRAAAELEAPDAISNDGWGWSIDGPDGRLGGAAVTELARAAHDAGVWFHLWYDPIQGYPIPADGPRDLRYDHPAAQVLGWLAAGVAEGPDAPGEATGLGREVVLGYREGRFEPRRNWVLDCRDYAYSARFDEHRECDGRYDPDGTGHGTATFVFEDVPRDLYEVALEGRNTENRNPAGALVVVNGVERRLNQIGEGEFAFEIHGTYALEGRVTVVLDSTREDGSDSVRRVRIRPVGR